LEHQPEGAPNISEKLEEKIESTKPDRKKTAINQ